MHLVWDIVKFENINDCKIVLKGLIIDIFF
jgi:hypothetical protein